MHVRLRLPPFGEYETEIDIVGSSLKQVIALENGAMYTLAFTPRPARDPQRAVVFDLSSITCMMPPLTPEADSMKRGDAARLPEPHAADEAELRRKEWAARGVAY